MMREKFTPHASPSIYSGKSSLADAKENSNKLPLKSNAISKIMIIIA